MKTKDIQLLQQMLDEGYVTTQKHPHADLYIYNYTAAAQYEKKWNAITLQCRGLIMDKNYQIVARPFAKFFNLEEHAGQSLPDTAFDVFEKLDGSLGILYWLNNEAYIASRGSFGSEQALKGTEILNKKYIHILHTLDKSLTYLFEIIYPENRIVLDYGGMEDLVLLAVIDTQSGTEMNYDTAHFPVAKKYDGVRDIYTLSKNEEQNKEGYVIRFANGMRVKVKFAEYLRIHKIVTMVSTTTVWEYLKDERPFDELLDKVPDEFYTWVKATKEILTGSYEVIEAICKQEYKELETEKETALYFFTCTYPTILFSMLRKKNYQQQIWKMVKPKFSKPFSNALQFTQNDQ
ncbi:MAG: T4 RnlA family RNA ligase [Chitinophagaceae bacterium]|nr:T4 RnlA family RNA ligase [Chitinophagaceae bacterium]